MYAFLTTHEKIVTSIMMYIRLRQIGLNSSGETTLNAEKIPKKDSMIRVFINDDHYDVFLDDDAQKLYFV